MGIKTYNPYTPSRRHMTGSDFSEITKKTPEKSLLASKKKHAGRNNQGKITVRHRGGGSRRKYRIIDFKRTKEQSLGTGEVSGGGRKPWRQKGTGHARQGSTRSPQWKGGGVVFAPVPRDYSFKMNKKEKRAALKSVLSDKVATSKLLVLDELKFDEIKTKKFKAVMDNLKVEGKSLVVLGEKDDVVIKSAKNLPLVQTALPGTINVYDILNAGTLILTKDAVTKIEEVYA